MFPASVGNRYIEGTKVSQISSYIWSTSGSIRWLRMLLLRSWKWRTTLGYEIMSSPDDLRVKLAKFASTAWSTAFENSLFEAYLILLDCRGPSNLSEICFYCLEHSLGKSVIYWPSTELSIKKCTCVNKRKNSGSRWTLENNLTRCRGGSSQLETGCQSENQLADWGLWALSDPRLSNSSQDTKEVLLWSRKNLGQYSSPSLSPLISHTQQTSPFRK